jgi:uncharacterized protein (DUF2249 family)
MVLFSAIEKNTENRVGLSVEMIRQYSPWKLREHLEKKNKQKFTFTSEFPAIGRGNILRDGIVDSDAINKDIDRILV